MMIHHKDREFPETLDEAIEQLRAEYPNSNTDGMSAEEKLTAEMKDLLSHVLKAEKECDYFLLLSETKVVVANWLIERGESKWVQEQDTNGDFSLLF